MQINAEQQARRLVATIPDDEVRDLRTDTLEAIEIHLNIRVELTPNHQQADGCGIEGSYHPDPPVIRVADTAYEPHVRFTALHELGHHLVEHDILPDLGDALFAAGPSARDLEEAIADGVAAHILIPDDLIEQHIPEPKIGPTARQVKTLAEETTASRSAACVAAAQRLGRSGWVMIGHDSTAFFTASYGLPWRIAKGVDQGPQSVLAIAAEHGHARRDATVTFRSGHTRNVIGDAIRADDGWVYAVLVIDRAPWEPLSRQAPEPTWNDIEGYCRKCRTEFVTWKRPCPTCDEAIHEDCGFCRCGIVDVHEIRCSICDLVKAEHLVNERGICRDCE